MVFFNFEQTIVFLVFFYLFIFICHLILNYTDNMHTLIYIKLNIIIIKEKKIDLVDFEIKFYVVNSSKQI